MKTFFHFHPSPCFMYEGQKPLVLNLLKKKKGKVQHCTSKKKKKKSAQIFD